MNQNHQVTPDGVLFDSKERAKAYADLYDKDLEEGKDGWWLAKNRIIELGPMPTVEGDVVVLHLHQLYRIWITTWNGAQGPDPNIAPQDLWNADEAKYAAAKWAATTKSQIY